MPSETRFHSKNASQAEIAARLEVSSSKVSRLLKEAWELGIIEVNVRKPTKKVEAA
jgi:DNA-binding transcriptional regulator LsrR (DeoR family)